MHVSKFALSRLHFELLPKDAAVRPTIRFKERISQLRQLRPEQDPFADFVVFRGLERSTTNPAMTCIERLATADIPVIGKSSSSYPPTISTVSGIVLYHPFWHYPPDDWIVTKPSGHFDAERFLTQLRRLRARR